MKKLIILFVSTITFYSPIVCNAEKCWMVGCVGDIGYIYVPRTQYEYNNQYKMGNGDYTIDASGKLLKEDNLPVPGSEVTLNIMTPLLGSRMIEDANVIERFDYNQWLRDDKNKVMKMSKNMDLHVLGQLMGKNTVLQVLGYALSGDKDKDYLFMLVRIVKDG